VLDEALFEHPLGPLAVRVWNDDGTVGTWVEEVA
jgi:hypothetical protein